jgi:hypothetical protein
MSTTMSPQVLFVYTAFPVIASIARGTTPRAVT